MLWPLLLEYSCRQFYESNIVNLPFMCREAIDLSILHIKEENKGVTVTHFFVFFFFHFEMFLLGVDDNWLTVRFQHSCNVFHTATPRRSSVSDVEP